MSRNVIRDTLVGLSDRVYHYSAPPDTPPPYIIWMEDGANDFEAGNRHVEFVDQGTIDLYTLDEDDPLMQAIPAALNATPAAWYRNSVQYEEETKLIHYEWVWEV